MTAVLSRRDEDGARAFEVRVLDGRHFVVRYLAETDRWELVSVHGQGTRQRVARVATSPLLMPLLIALYRRGIEIVRRSRKSVVENAIPRGGAPA